MVFLFTSIDHPELFQQAGTSEADHILACQFFLIEEILGRHHARWMRRTQRGVLSVFEPDDSWDRSRGKTSGPPSPGAGGSEPPPPSAAGGPAEAALALLKDFQNHLWGKFGKSKIRLVLHVGEAEPQGQNYVGPDVSHALKLLEAAWGGQALLTIPAVHFIPLPAGCRLKDLGKHFLKDLSEPRNVFALQHPDLEEGPLPPLMSLQKYRQNFSPQPSPFFGREEEMGEVADFLARPSERLLTLLGPGGFGKTRLALQSAAEAVEQFRDGAYLVALAPLLSDQLMVGSIANAIQFFFFGAEDPKTQLLNHLKEKEMLLVMDNFEHIIEGAQLVREILAAAPRLKILATSREKLRVEGEGVLEVKGLRYPSDGQNKGFEASSAVQLFQKSARRIKPDFSLAPGDRDALLKICRLLEGMPLGLELAASWASTLQLHEIADKIETSRDFLATSTPYLPPRHRSLRAVFEYSWILLSEDQKKVLKSISVFKGGFSAAAAGRIAGATESLLAYLENKSLVRKRSDGRFEIHELLKLYAKEKLFDDPAEKERALDDHCAYFAGLLRSRRGEFCGPAQRKVLEELVEDMGNLREGWTRAVDKVLEAELGDYLDGLFFICETKGWFQEAKQAYRRAAEALEEKYPGGSPRPAASTLLLARLLGRWAEFEKNLGDPRKARQLYEDSLALCREASAEPLGASLAGLGIVCETGGDYHKAKFYYEKSLAAFRRAKDRSGITLALNHLGHISSRIGDLKGAQDHIRQSLAYSEEDRDQRAMAYSYNLMGDALHELGRFEESRIFYQKGLSAYLESGDRRGMAWSFTNLGRAAEVLGDYDGARQMYKEGMAISRDLGDLRGLAWSANLLGFVDWATGDYAEAQHLFDEGLFLYQEVGDPRGQAWTLDLMGNLKLAQREVQDAENFYLQSYALLGRDGLNAQNKAWHAYHLGTLAVCRRDFKEAQRRFNEGSRNFQRLGDALGRATTLIQLGEIACQQGNLDAGRRSFEEAASIALQSRMIPFLVDLLVGVAQLLKAEGDERQAIGFLMVALSHPTCRRPTKDRVVAFSLELQSHFPPEEVEGAIQWAKAARIEDVVSAWLSSSSRRPSPAAGRKKGRKKHGPRRPLRGRKAPPKKKRKTSRKTRRKK